MRRYKYVINIKASLFIFGIILIIVFLSYTRSLINELRDDNKEIVRLYAGMIADVVKDDSDVNLDFVFENIIKKVKFPIIQTDNDKKIQMWKNLPHFASDIDKSEQRLKFMQIMDRVNEPIPLIYRDKILGDITFGFLHYGDSLFVQKLQNWTYIVVTVIILFIFVGFLGFSFIRNNEKNSIWIGMARETAHQLGTPLSALIGWKEWLMEHPEKVKKILPEMESDLDRLSQIGRRFSNMGSTPEFEMLNLSHRMISVIEYLKKRLPTLGKKVNLKNNIDPDINIKANGSLLAWSIENIIRNSIDAISQENGEVKVSLKKDQKIIILVEDNGYGIPRKDWRNIFRPGFSTKKAGWGLGLSLSKRIIQDIHGGKLHVLKSNINEGTVIQIIL